MKTWQKLHQNPHLWKRYFLREKVISAIREFFRKKEFHEIEVPLLTPALPAESYLEIFETTLLNRHRQKKRAFLTTSPELFLKKLLVSGVGSCYSVTKSFRNTEDLSSIHNPEFTILEWYHVGVDYTHVMEDTEHLLIHVFETLYPQNKQPNIIYGGQQIDLTFPWERISVSEAFRKYAKIDLEKVLTLKSLRSIAIVRGYKIGKEDIWEELFNQIFLNEVEPHFSKNRPTIIYDYPIQLAALAAKPKVSDPRFVERFEVYIGGIELADCCTELIDVEEQKRRFKKEINEIRKKRKNKYSIDHEFIEALKFGLPPCAGIALGVDRLIMLFADVSRIQDTLFFPADEMWNPI